MPLFALANADVFFASFPSARPLSTRSLSVGLPLLVVGAPVRAERDSGSLRNPEG